MSQLGLLGQVLASRRRARTVTGMNPEAGWYDDPINHGMLRYWDGLGWTDQTQERPAIGSRGDSYEGTPQASGFGWAPAETNHDSEESYGSFTDPYAEPDRGSLLGSSMGAPADSWTHARPHGSDAKVDIHPVDPDGEVAGVIPPWGFPQEGYLPSHSLSTAGVPQSGDIIGARTRGKKSRRPSRKLTAILVGFAFLFVGAGLFPDSPNTRPVIDTSPATGITIPDSGQLEAETGSDGTDLSTDVPADGTDEGFPVEQGAADSETGSLVGVEVGAETSDAVTGSVSAVEFAGSSWIVNTLTLGWAPPEDDSAKSYSVRIRWSGGEKTISSEKTGITVKGVRKKGCTITITAIAASGRKTSSPSFACGKDIG